MSFYNTTLRSKHRKDFSYIPLKTEENIPMGHTTDLDGERVVDGEEEIILQKDVKKKWVSYIWDTFDKSPEERRFLTKLDAAILTFASLGKSRAPFHPQYISQLITKNSRLLH
jgi:hypothetical protein